MRTCILRKVTLCMVVIAAMGLWTQTAKGAAALWISAPNWSYSAAAADSPVGWVYFWGLSAGAGTYSFAYAFSNDGLGDAGYAFAEASAGNLGGQGAIQVSGAADPYAGVSIDATLTDPSNPSGYPNTKPGTDPFSSAYTVSNTGITFTESGSQLDGSYGIEAFTYPGGTDLAALESALGVSSDTGSSLGGDVTDIATLEADFGLVPLDSMIKDTTGMTSLNFTENDSNVNPNNVILVGISVPEPTTFSMALLGLGGLALRRRRRAA